MINKVRFIFLTCMTLCALGGVAQAQRTSDDSILVALKTVDPELLPYFPPTIP